MFTSVSVNLNIIHCAAFLSLSCPLFLADVYQEADGNNHCGKPEDAL